MQQTSPWPAAILDALVAVCLTVLIGTRSIPPEAGLTMLGTFIGARAVARLQGPPPGAGGTGSPPAAGASPPKSGLARTLLAHAHASAVIGLLVVALGWVQHHRGHT